MKRYNRKSVRRNINRRNKRINRRSRSRSRSRSKKRSKKRNKSRSKRLSKQVNRRKQSKSKKRSKKRSKKISKTRSKTRMKGGSIYGDSSELGMPEAAAERAAKAAEKAAKEALKKDKNVVVTIQAIGDYLSEIKDNGIQWARKGFPGLKAQICGGGLSALIKMYEKMRDNDVKLFKYYSKDSLEKRSTLRDLDYGIGVTRKFDEKRDEQQIAKKIQGMFPKITGTFDFVGGVQYGYYDKLIQFLKYLNGECDRKVLSEIDQRQARVTTFLSFMGQLIVSPTTLIGMAHALLRGLSTLLHVAAIETGGVIAGRTAFLKLKDADDDDDDDDDDQSGGEE